MSDEQRLLTPPFRIQYPNVFVPTAFDEKATKKFGLCAIWTPAKFSDRDKKLWKAMMSALNAEALHAFKKDLKELPSTYKIGMRDGSEKPAEAGFGEGTRFANLTSMYAPGVIDLRKNIISLDEGNTDEIYAGCWARGRVNTYSFNNVGKGVAFGILSLQKIRDDEPLRGGGNAVADFEDEELDEQWLETEDESVDDFDDDF